MRVECPNCHKVYHIADERLPSGKEIAFPCPACKGTIKLDLRPKSAQDGMPSPQMNQKEQQKTAGPPPSDTEQPSGEALKNRILRTVGDLPPMPQTVLKAREIMGDPSSSFKELAKVLETDPAIAAKVLKMANSSYYGLGGQVSSIQHASVVLGHKTIGDLMTMAGTSGLMDNTLKGYGLEAGDLWRHSPGVAFGSRMIANKKNPALANDAFAAGLIHDAGKLILDRYVFERKEAFKGFMADGQQSFLSAEKQLLGFDHSEIASEVCKSWNVPQALTVAIRYHHYPSESQRDELAYIVHMADAIAMMTGMGTGIDGMLYQMDNKAMEFLGLQEEDLSSIMVEVVESVEKIAGQT
ncbi:MAG: zinc-ribbon domain-containing protein [Deltaproteobacteria bacterium]|nr:zinc-ribbon domain-containing protein [Deltaproteobacteria bacterium]MBW2019982.1 zinc-ribbon domain-containing protein [Deltaproteobacteria bacterium]MBW2075043.1 zinc-ribbon domain-containing protein [Deltaproteobacteria bacterium]